MPLACDKYLKCNITVGNNIEHIMIVLTRILIFIDRVDSDVHVKGVVVVIDWQVLVVRRDAHVLAAVLVLK